MPCLHLRCRGLGPCPCLPRGSGGSSPLQPPPPALPPPAKPLAHAAPSLLLSVLWPAAALPWGPRPSLQNIAVPGGSRAQTAPSCSAQVQHGREVAPTASSPHPPHRPLGSGEQLSASARASLGVRRPPPALPAAILPFSPGTSKTCPEVPCGTHLVLEGYLPPDQPTGSSTLGPQTGHGTPNGAYTAVPGSRPPCPSAHTLLQHVSLLCPAPRLLHALRAHMLGPGQHRHGGAEDARGGPAATPSSVAQGLCNPLLPVAGVTEAPSGQT